MDRTEGGSLGMLGASRLCRRQESDWAAGKEKGVPSKSPRAGGDPARARGWASVPQAASGPDALRPGGGAGGALGGAVPEPGLRAAGR